MRFPLGFGTVSQSLEELIWAELELDPESLELSSLSLLLWDSISAKRAAASCLNVSLTLFGESRPLSQSATDVPSGGKAPSNSAAENLLNRRSSMDLWPGWVARWGTPQPAINQAWRVNLDSSKLLASAAMVFVLEHLVLGLSSGSLWHLHVACHRNFPLDSVDKVNLKKPLAPQDPEDGSRPRICLGRGAAGGGGGGASAPAGDASGGGAGPPGEPAGLGCGGVPGGADPCGDPGDFGGGDLGETEVPLGG